MRRWNGWGDDQRQYVLTGDIQRVLSGLLGPGRPAQDALREKVLAGVPASRLPYHPLIDISPEVRLTHARGQSLPDWIALRAGRIPYFPDGVAFPGSGEEVRSLLGYAREHKAALIPYGGGTSVAGHVNVVEDRPTLTVSLARMNRLLELDEASLLATFQAGVNGPLLESQLQARGLTMGHYPQSFEYSTLGGWVATRSSGQLSLGYGRIEKLVAGLRVETPQGEMVLPAYPASAAGPDLKELFLGSRGPIRDHYRGHRTGLPAAGTGVLRRLFLPRFSGRPGCRERTGAPPPAPDHAPAVHSRRNQLRSGHFWKTGHGALAGALPAAAGDGG